MQRRREIGSDLSEHARARAADGWPAERTGRERTGRLVRGVPADLAWRAEVLASAGRSTGPVRTAVTTIATVASLALASYTGAFALYLSGDLPLAERPFLHGLASYADEVDPSSSITLAVVVMASISALLLVAAAMRPIAPVAANVVTLPIALIAVVWFWLGIAPLGLVALAGAAADLVLRAPAVAPTS